MYYTMPKIDPEAFKGVLSEEEFAWACAIISTKGETAGCLRASKPGGKAAPQSKYIWRQVAFFVSPMPMHQCVPTTDIFDLHDCVASPDDKGGSWVSRANEYGKYLDKIVDVIVNTIPVKDWHGVNRWSRVL